MVYYVIPIDNMIHIDIMKVGGDDMFHHDFLKRTNFQQVCEFFRTGGAKVPGTEEEGTLEDRFYRAE